MDADRRGPGGPQSDPGLGTAVPEPLPDADSALAGDDGEAHPFLPAFAHLLSELTVSKNRYSDWFKRRRRRHELSVSAELQRRQLPPLTCVRPASAIAVLRDREVVGLFTLGDDSSMPMLEVRDPAPSGGQCR